MQNPVHSPSYQLFTPTLHTNSFIPTHPHQLIHTNSSHQLIHTNSSCQLFAPTHSYQLIRTNSSRQLFTPTHPYQLFTPTRSYQLLHANSSHQLIHTFIPTLHTSSITPTVVTPSLHASSSYQLIPTPHTNSSYQLFTPTLHTNFSYRFSKPTLHASSPHQLFIPTLHTNSSYQLFTPTRHANSSCQLSTPTLYANSITPTLSYQSIHTNNLVHNQTREPTGSSRVTKALFAQGAHRSLTRRHTLPALSRGQAFAFSGLQPPLPPMATAAVPPPTAAPNQHLTPTPEAQARVQSEPLTTQGKAAEASSESQVRGGAPHTPLCTGKVACDPSSLSSLRQSHPRTSSSPPRPSRASASFLAFFPPKREGRRKEETQIEREERERRGREGGERDIPRGGAREMGGGEGEKKANSTMSTRQRGHFDLHMSS